MTRDKHCWEEDDFFDKIEPSNILYSYKKTRTPTNIYNSNSRHGFIEIENHEKVYLSNKMRRIYGKDDNDKKDEDDDDDYDDDDYNDGYRPRKSKLWVEEEEIWIPEETNN